MIRAMNVVTLDTHAIVKELQAAGFSEPQAEAVTRVVKQAQDIDLSHLATKDDIKDVRTEIKDVRTEIKEAELRLEVQITRSKAELLKWMFGALAAQTGVIVTLLKVL
ncbi:MAG: CCDC90 family protein [Magnetospirillum sp. WYHS-4]